MSRRALTLLLSGVLTLALTVAASATTVPYVAYTPGPAFDTLGEVDGTPVITVDGRQTFPTDGHLDLTTVSVRPRLTLAQALTDWFRADRAVVPRELLYPPDQSDEQVREQNKARFEASETAATTAALRALGVPVTTSVTVAGVEKGLPADGRLEDGDVLTAVDGARVDSTAQVRDRISALAPGTPVQLAYVRDGAAGEVTLTTVPAPDDPKRGIVGVTLAERPQYPFTVTISLQDVGGPSAGLMFALGIVDKLGPESLTGGRHIAGTGEIDDEGTVGAIGGIPQKMRGAKALGATVFLVPAENCKEAVENAPGGLQLVRVSTLTDAISALRTLADGGTPQACAS